MGLERALAVPLDVPDAGRARPALLAGLGIERVPYFTHNIFADRDLIEAFMAMHCAIEEGRDVLRERELLIGSFGRLFQRHGSGGNRIPRGAGRPAASLRVKDRMHADYARELRLEDLARRGRTDDLPAHRPVQAAPSA